MLNKNVALFLFAHQDDEFGVYQAIIDEIDKGREVYCAYLTNGDFGGISPIRRNQESLDVLSKLGVPKQNIHFAGSDLHISDGCLPDNLIAASNWIHQWFHTFEDIKSIYVTAWEGGHQDHDALHALTVSIAQDISILPCVRQFSLYNSDRCPGILFRVFHPLLQNGVVTNRKIPFVSRFSFLIFCLSYPSQVKTWIGLFPFVIFHYFTNGKQQLQTTSIERISQRPHEGELYYEKRGFFTWEKMSSSISLLRRPECESKN